MSELVKCHRCNALYAKGGWWSGRRYSEGTQPERFYASSRIPDEHCPICRKPPQLIAEQQVRTCF